MAEEKNIRKTVQKIAPALIVAGAAAAAAGYFFYGSKNAEKNRKQAAKWATEMKGEVMKGVRDLQKVDKRAVLALVDKAASSYKRVSSARQSDVARAAAELRKNWERLVKESGTRKKAPRPRTKRRAASGTASAPRKRKSSS